MTNIVRFKIRENVNLKILKKPETKSIIHRYLLTNIIHKGNLNTIINYILTMYNVYIFQITFKKYETHRKRLRKTVFY